MLIRYTLQVVIKVFQKQPNIIKLKTMIKNNHTDRYNRRIL